MSDFSGQDHQWMRLALELAARGQGWVEPNPMVGCVLVADNQIVGRGYHQRFGEAHAEVNALSVAGPAARDATAYVTLEPCCHTGKTPPCSDALLAAGVRRVVVAQQDPFPQVAGGGLRQLSRAGVEVQVGLLEDEARRLNAPYLKRVAERTPWVIAKWAMTLDGKIASREQHSQWISSPESRRRVHAIRGRVDAVMVGRQTAASDDPRLTARPPGPRRAARVVLDSNAQLRLDSQLVRSARDPSAGTVLVAVASASVQPNRCRQLESAGCEIVRCAGTDHADRLVDLLHQLAERQMTNVLVEGGGKLLGSLMDLRQIDEAHVFVSPKIVGGADAITPMAGRGLASIDLAARLVDPEVEQLAGDLYIRGYVRHDNKPTPDPSNSSARRG